MRTRLVSALVVAAFAFAACSSAATPGATGATAPAVTGGGLTVYAAASLKAALAKAKVAWESANPGMLLSISTDSSAALEAKIEAGAPADVFLSADTANPQKLVDGGFASGGVTPFAGNRLTVIVPADNPAKIVAPADLAKSGVKIIAAGDNVPITKYAAKLVANLTRQSGYPADFAARYAANVVTKEDNVAAIVAKIELGEGDAGIVYATDAKGSSKAATIAVPDAANVPATYGGVVVKASAHPAAAAAFLAWLAGPDGRAILASFGFVPPS
jgi:molybdate transport system substrate-binding protein